jgi:hypothetical protein
MYLIYLLDEVIGYTTSWQEADDICKKDHRLTWTFITTRDFVNLKQLTIYDITD